MVTEIDEVKQEIRTVVQQVAEVVQEIAHVEKQVKPDATETVFSHWQKEKDRLREREEKLREKERELREKELLLLKADTSEPPSKKKKMSSEETLLDYFKELLDDHYELPQSVDDIKKFLSKTTVQLPVSQRTYFSVGFNVHDLLRHWNTIEEMEMSILASVELAFGFDFKHPPNEATSSWSLFHLSGYFLEVLNKVAPAGCGLRSLLTVLDLADKPSKSAPSAFESKLRPDCLVYVREILMLRWENKLNKAELPTACEENVEKLKVWSPLYYGTLPYVIGGGCAGATFRWLKLSPDGEKIIADPLLEYDLSTPRGVALFLHSTVRMHCLLQKLQEVDPQFRPVCLYRPNLRSNGGEVVVYPYKVVKKVKPPLDVEKIKALYKSIKSSSFLIQLLKIRGSKSSTVLELQPVGDPNSRPHDLKDLKNATHDILWGLADLHQQGYTHRDLRWENCIKVNVQGEWKWVLIDLEAAGSDEGRWDVLRCWDSGTLADRKGKKLYTMGSDIYHLGKLIVGWLDSYGRGGVEERVMRNQGKNMQKQRRAATKILEEFCENGCGRCGKFKK